MNITIAPAHSPMSVTRERRHAAGANGGAIELTIARDGTGHMVSWTVNRGDGWSKPWACRRATEAEARAFADEKWPSLVAWLEKLRPVASGGAAAVFSAQVASMHR